MKVETTGASEAAAYYDESETEAFYRLCWGGADIHIGRYDAGAETIADASVEMTRYLLSLAGFDAGDRVLDIACGFGGTLRELARRGCLAQGIDISQRCVDEARRSAKAAGLEDRISVERGDFHHIETGDGEWDGCICQESIIHSRDRARVFREAFRILRPGGAFAVSDIVVGEDADLAKVEAAFERLGAEPSSTSGDYRSMAVQAGFKIEHAETRLRDIQTHYDSLAQQLENPPEELAPETVDRLAHSIGHWRAALANGNITWACLIARKP